MNGRLIRPLFGLRVSSMVERTLFLAFAVALAFALPHTPDGLVGLGLLGSSVIGMYVDAQTVLSDAQALTVTAYSTNTYDTGAAGNEITAGEPLGVVFTVDVAAKTSNSDETYQFLLVQSANADLSSHDILAQSDTTFISRTKLVKGFRFAFPFPSSIKTKRYLGVRYVMGGTSPTLTITSELMPLSMLQNEVLYAGNFTISS